MKSVVEKASEDFFRIYNSISIEYPDEIYQIGDSLIRRYNKNDKDLYVGAINNCIKYALNEFNYDNKTKGGRS